MGRSEERAGPRPPGRRPVTTVEAIEKVAIDLLLQRGYDAVSVDDLARAAGISRATYFRYFPTKAGVVWLGFDRALDQLEASLAAAEEATPPMEAIRSAVATSVKVGIDPDGVWWERFQLLDSVADLRADAGDRWGRWIMLVSTFVAGRMGLPPGHPFPVAIASAHQGVYLATLRTWVGDPRDPETMLTAMLDAMTVVGGELSGLLLRADARS